MATQAVKVKNEESQGGIAVAAGNLSGKVSGSIQAAKEFLHDVRVETKQVTWPSRDYVVSTTSVVIATIFFFGVFLAVVDWLVLRGVNYIFKVFGV
jgi:preprotein translocase SecE subunit